MHRPVAAEFNVLFLGGVPFSVAGFQEPCFKYIYKYIYIYIYIYINIYIYIYMYICIYV